VAVGSGSGPAVGALLASTRKPLTGGTYDPDELIELLNSHFFLAKTNGAYPIAQIEPDGSIRYISRQDFATKLANIFAIVGDGRGGQKKVKAETFWLAHEKRDEREIVFEPKEPSARSVTGKHNAWSGYAVEPQRPTGKQRRFVRHLREIICKGDKIKFRYLIRWLAFLVQHPDKNPETAIVLKSAHEGTGKTTVNYALCKIFGGHALTISDKGRLFDRFNSTLETVVLLAADELLWAGDRATADALKSLITGNSIVLEVKHGARWSIPNRLHIIMTTNHEHAIQAGVQDRRFFVLEVSSRRASDSTYFDPLYADLDDGGVEELLWFLLRVRLDGWHPRQLPKTDESIEQQRFSADSVSQWAQACIDADAVIGHPLQGPLALGQTHPSNLLYEAYKNYCRTYPVAHAVFGKALTQMLGSPIRKSVGSNTARPRAYRVPDADTWQQALDRRLGIGKIK
jgi:hypothetical protein